MTWHHTERPELGFADGWSRTLSEMEESGKVHFPDLRRAPTLVVTSDYGGCHKGSKFETLSFLLAALDQGGEWESKRRLIRQMLLPGGRRMSFKNLNDRHRRNALASLLDAANEIPGVVVTFCVSNSLDLAALGDEAIDRTESDLAPLHLFRPSAFRRLVRLSAFVGLFLGGLSAPMQDVLWFSDQDEIVADEKRIRAATKVAAQVCAMFAHHPMGHLRFGSTRCDDGSRSIEDLAAIPDLAAGAFAEMLMKAGTGGVPSVDLVMPLPGSLTMKSRYILSWLANQSVPLKKVTCVLSEGNEPQTLQTRWFHLYTTPAHIQLPHGSPTGYRGSIFGRIP